MKGGKFLDEQPLELERDKINYRKPQAEYTVVVLNMQKMIQRKSQSWYKNRFEDMCVSELVTFNDLVAIVDLETR